MSVVSLDAGHEGMLPASLHLPGTLSAAGGESRRAAYYVGAGAGRATSSKSSGPVGFPFVVHVLSNGEPYDRWTWWSDDVTTEAVVLEWTKMLVAARYLFDRPEAPDPDVDC